LKIAEGLSLPLDAVTQTFLIVGKRGSGKSNTAARFVEQLYHARLPFVVLDPVDTWWGLKAGRDGGRGLDVYVFGGRKADLPLEAGAGALIAEVLCEHRMPMVLSVKHLSGRERSAFMVAFAQTLFQKWGGGPLHVVLEEAHELAPQMSGGRGGSNQDNEAAMLGAFKRLWKLGRSSGIGGTAVTQRPASLSKDITTQSEILIAHRTIGPQDVKAIGEWVKYHGQRDDILADLPSMPTGEAVVWAPEFPEGKPLGLMRTRVLLRETYDSASTPKVGEQRVEPKELAAVDLDRLRLKMAATIAKAQADDPRELRKQLAEAMRELNALRSAAKVNAVLDKAAPVGKPVPVLTDADRETLATVQRYLKNIEAALGAESEALIATFEHKAEKVFAPILARFHQDAETIHLNGRQEFEAILNRVGFQRVLDKLDRVTAVPAPAPRHTHTPPPRTAQPSPAPTRQATPRTPVAAGDRDLGKCERTILGVLSTHGASTSGRLTLLAGYRYSGGFKNSLSALRQAGYIVGENTGVMSITDAGQAALGDIPTLPTNGSLGQYWLNHPSFGKAERAILEVLLASPRGLTSEAICAATGYAYSGGFKNSLSALRTAGVIVGKNTEVMRPNEELVQP